jgi:hypothetical protein
MVWGNGALAPPVPSDTTLEQLQAAQQELDQVILDRVGFRNPQAQLSQLERLTFRTVLESHRGFGKKIEFATASGKYAVWYREFEENGQTVYAFNIQSKTGYGTQSDKLGINIDKLGNVLSVMVNDEKTEPPYDTLIPNRWLETVKEAYRCSLKNSTKYGFTPHGRVNVETVALGIKEIPLYHLEKLSEMIFRARQSMDTPFLSVKFLEADLAQSLGIDIGGLSRTFLNDLFEAVTKNQQYLIFDDINGLCQPVTRAGAGGEIPKLEKEEKERYMEIGRIMMYCYKSKKDPGGFFDQTCLTGEHFHPSLFQAALAMQTDDIYEGHANTDRWVSNPLTIIDLLAKQQDAPAFERECLAYLKIVDPSQDEATVIALKLAERGALTEALWQDDDHDELDLGKITPELVKQAAQNFLFRQFGRQLEPIRAIACGMKQAICQNPGEKDAAWRDLQTTHSAKPAEFGIKIQGIFTRQTLADCFEYIGHDPVVNQKIEWLKAWILDQPRDGHPGTSDDELRGFLKFATGSTSLGVNKKIKVQLGFEHQWILKAHTCTPAIDISFTYKSGKDDSFETFVKMLREHVLPGADHLGFA